MISLSRHIELLLLEHDCVIVPGLGGFIANHVEAQYNGEDEPLFMPPYRTIRFNQQLQMNDGLLVQSYMAAYDASYPAAYLQMEKDIDNVVYELETSGEVIFDKIGVLQKGINQSIAFTPSETNILTPSLYGLYSYEIQSLSKVIKERDVKEALNAASAMAVNANGDDVRENNSKKRNNGVILLHRRWIDVSISVAAAIVLLFCVSYQALRNNASDTDTVVAAFYNTTNDVKFVTNPSPDKKIVSPSKITNTESNEAMTEVTTPTSKVEEKSPQMPEPKFAIVLASFVSKTNAETFIENLAKQGFEEARYAKKGKVSHILYSNYKDKEEAQQALQELRQQCKEFAEAWILEL